MLSGTSRGRSCGCSSGHRRPAACWRSGCSPATPRWPWPRPCRDGGRLVACELDDRRGRRSPAARSPRSAAASGSTSGSVRRVETLARAGLGGRALRPGLPRRRQGRATRLRRRPARPRPAAPPAGWSCVDNTLHAGRAVGRGRTPSRQRRARSPPSTRARRRPPASSRCWCRCATGSPWSGGSTVAVTLARRERARSASRAIGPARGDACPLDLLPSPGAVGARRGPRAPAAAPDRAGATVLLSGGKMTKALRPGPAFHARRPPGRAGRDGPLPADRRTASPAPSTPSTSCPDPTLPEYAEALLRVVRHEGVDVWVPVSSPASSLPEAEAAERARRPLRGRPPRHRRRCAGSTTSTPSPRWRPPSGCPSPRPTGSPIPSR